MNYQTNIVQELIKEAAKRLECLEDEIEFYAWPQAFGNTAGPNGGCGGNTITTFTIFGLAGPGREGYLHCASKWKKVRAFKPLMKW